MQTAYRIGFTRGLVPAFLALALLLAPFVAAPPAQAAPQAAIVLDAGTGSIFLDCDAEKALHPASLTKMMTLYLTFDALDAGELTLDQELSVSAEAASRPRTNLGLKMGDTIKVEDAILALATKSANDVATVLAETLGGSEETFAHIMTRQAHQLGMYNTLFRNASGLPNDEQLSSPRDMATLALALWHRFPEYYGYFKTREFSWKGSTYKSTNGLLREYDGVDGVKTGYIRASGFNLVTSAERNGHRLVAVVFGGPSAYSRNNYMKQLLDYGFSLYPDTGEAATEPPEEPFEAAHYKISTASDLAPKAMAFPIAADHAKEPGCTFR